MAAIVSIATFERPFMRKGISIASLKRTIKNSQLRIDAGLSANAEQTEINRIKAAANAIEKRGTSSDKVHAKTKKKDMEKSLQLRQFIRRNRTALTVGGIALLLFGVLVARP